MGVRGALEQEEMPIAAIPVEAPNVLTILPLGLV